MCQHCEGYDHRENTAALGSALIRRQEERQRAAANATPAPSREQPGPVRPTDRS